MYWGAHILQRIHVLLQTAEAEQLSRPHTQIHPLSERKGLVIFLKYIIAVCRFGEIIQLKNVIFRFRCVGNSYRYYYLLLFVFFAQFVFVNGSNFVQLLHPRRSIKTGKNNDHADVLG